MRPSKVGNWYSSTCRLCQRLLWLHSAVILTFSLCINVYKCLERHPPFPTDSLQPEVWVSYKSCQWNTLTSCWQGRKEVEVICLSWDITPARHDVWWVQTPCSTVSGVQLSEVALWLTVVLSISWALNCSCSGLPLKKTVLIVITTFIDSVG
jgi:hypothetical protein